MAAIKPTYILAPNWDFLPDGPIFLGSLIIDPKNPARSLNMKNRIPIAPTDITTSPKNDWSITGEELRSGRVGIWANFLAPILGIGADAAIHGTQDKNDLYECKTMETRYFQPDEAYIAKSLQDPVVKAYTEKFWHKSVYMVTGVKIAKGATMKTSRGTRSGAELKLGFDGTPVGLPAGGGPKVKGETNKKFTVQFGGSDDFVLGYQLIRIKLKKDRSFVEEDFNKWALLNDDDGNTAEKATQALKQAWDIENLVTLTDELQGMVAGPVSEEDCNIITTA